MSDLIRREDADAILKPFYRRLKEIEADAYRRILERVKAGEYWLTAAQEESQRAIAEVDAAQARFHAALAALPTYRDDGDA